jgi:hypothetical protein
MPANSINFRFSDGKFFTGFFWKFIREELMKEYERNKTDDQQHSNSQN